VLTAEETNEALRRQNRAGHWRECRIGCGDGPAICAGRWAIVNVASIYGSQPSDVGHAPYCASKFGVIELTKSAAVDYGQSGLRINAVAPGYTHSEMVNPDRPGAAERLQILAVRHSAMNRLGEAEEVARAITWLCSEAAGFVNGSVLAVDGGETTRLD